MTSLSDINNQPTGREASTADHQKTCRDSTKRRHDLRAGEGKCRVVSYPRGLLSPSISAREVETGRQTGRVENNLSTFLALVSQASVLVNPENVMHRLVFEKTCV